ncbi:hypothetical protein D9V34_15885 [Mycetocola lacteus]|uniref:Uncharacterized protein n=1 Tax=Mycetocola lacteus TaxID=76637 RepID=A0A3L7AFT0_9MICO|nr:hypothetical protein [Mycetocola lacteus]RLP79273.1 hypothetical protein D9V34_15885 [Mycetocola lacteus]
MIPLIPDGEWYLPAGIYRTDLSEIEDRFVKEAPFPDERQRVFEAFKLWIALVRDLLPGARFWINGGFVTHKTWAAPSDVDVMILVKSVDVNALSESEQGRFEQLLTDTSGPRVQPMSGLVDAFVCFRGDVGDTVYWKELWAEVLDQDRKQIIGRKKGYLEVVL